MDNRRVWVWLMLKPLGAAKEKREGDDDAKPQCLEEANGRVPGSIPRVSRQGWDEGLPETFQSCFLPVLTVQAEWPFELDECQLSMFLEFPRGGG